MTATLPKDFDEFLFASIGEDTNGNPLTLLSALARLNLDPWDEAASIARLPTEPATQRLATLLASLPKGLASCADWTMVATRLIALLHRSPARKGRAQEAAPMPTPPGVMAPQSKGINPAIYYFLALIFLLVGQCVMASTLPCR